jgi:predicted AlkP superfamily phosphohydrolase/phosphomutase
VACVFDTSERVQHMFYRFLDPPEWGRPSACGGLSGRPTMHTRVDRLVGKTQQHVDEHTVLFVLSDHGFTSFRRA